MFIHLDLDCFFVSAHRTIDDSLLNIPVAVGGRSNLNIFSSKKEIRNISSNRGAFVSTILTNEGEKSFRDYFVDENGKIRGIITTSSYEARLMGVKTAMSVNEALILCPNLKMIIPNYPLYHSLSLKLKKLLETEIPLIEQFSIDEFFGDLQGYKNENEIVEFSYKLKQKIYDELKLPISIGIANTKYLSKLLTEYAKPCGVKYVKANEIENFTKNVPISKFPGIGKSLQAKLSGYGIKTLGDIRKNKKLFYSWNKQEIDLYNRICGIKDNVLNLEKEKKSIGIGRTFDVIDCRIELKRRVMILCRYLCVLIKTQEVNPLTYAIKIKYKYSNSLKNYINVTSMFNEMDFKNQMIKLFYKTDIHKTHGIVQLNITVSNFSKKNDYASNIFDYQSDAKKQILSNQIHKLRDKYGMDIVKNAFEIKE